MGIEFLTARSRRRRALAAGRDRGPSGLGQVRGAASSRDRGSGAAARFYFVFSKSIYIERPVRRGLPPWIARGSTVVSCPSR